MNLKNLKNKKTNKSMRTESGDVMTLNLSVRLMNCLMKTSIVHNTHSCRSFDKCQKKVSTRSKCHLFTNKLSNLSESLIILNRQKKLFLALRFKAEAEWAVDKVLEVYRVEKCKWLLDISSRRLSSR